MEDRPSEPPPPLMADSEDEDAPLSNSEVLTRQEVLKRRMHRLKRLSKFYRDYYWLLMEDLRQKHRQFYWFNGKGPFVEEEADGDETENRNCENNINGGNDGKLGLGLRCSKSVNWCVYPTCKGKAMAMTNYCILHIVLDSNQVLYKGCKFPIQRLGGGEMGSLICGRAILRSTHPSICSAHAGQAKKEINQALKKAGVSVGLSSKITSKFNFHLVINEYVQMIQSRRRAAASRNRGRVAENGNTCQYQNHSMFGGARV